MLARQKHFVVSCAPFIKIELNPPKTDPDVFVLVNQLAGDVHAASAYIDHVVVWFPVAVSNVRVRCGWWGMRDSCICYHTGQFT